MPRRGTVHHGAAQVPAGVVERRQTAAHSDQSILRQFLGHLTVADQRDGPTDSVDAVRAVERVERRITRPVRRRHHAQSDATDLPSVSIVRMLLTEIDHVAIAVKDLEAAIGLLPPCVRRRGRAPRDRRERWRRRGAAESGESYVQLLTPTRDDSPVAKAIEKRARDCHHIGYRVATAARHWPA